ncbi:MAG: hypothetical protein HZA22_11355 [Nitrospirae bacterium]|nr:hypothetical protein [Nitrospirota bacterium]
METMYGDKEAAFVLLSHGAAINLVDKAENTPAHLAAFAFSAVALDGLAAKGADLDAVNEDGGTVAQVFLVMDMYRALHQPWTASGSGR